MIKVAPVSVCLIVRNEARQLEACLKSIRPYVSEICIVDTGSSDSTPEIARSYADKFETYTGCNDPITGLIESFSDARNRSLDLASNEWVLWVDGDDEVRDLSRLAEIVESRLQSYDGRAIQVMLPYEYSHDHKGNVTCLHYRERLVFPKSEFAWKNEVHEVLVCKNPNFTTYESDLVTVVHRRDFNGKVIESGRNLRILKKMYEKYGESDPRHLYYLGIEYCGVGDRENALKILKRYTELSSWDDEKYMACLKIIDLNISVGNFKEAIEWSLKATTINEKWGEAYFQIAKCYYFLALAGNDVRRNWERCVYFARHGLSLPRTKTVLFVNPVERDVEIHRYLNIALNNLNDVPGALESVRKALEFYPDDASLKLNYGIYVKHIAMGSISENLSKLHAAGQVKSDSIKAIVRILGGGSVEVQSDIVPSSGLPTGLDITIYVGQGVEAWNPSSVHTTGIGGSETAVVEMASRLAILGNRVTVYGHCIKPDGTSIEGVFGGVAYRDSSHYQSHKCDVLLTSRRPDAVDTSYGIDAKVKICWVHDIHCGHGLTYERSLKIDRFLTLSNWHKGYFQSVYPFIDPNRVLVTRNGIDFGRFENLSEVRNPHKAVYSSSPDRGLASVLLAWSEIREAVPDAELHIYYGFDTWEACSQNNPQQLNLIQHLKQSIKDHEGMGVVYHGRVDQKTLAREYASAGVWAYSTFFTETSCISAMEAQMAGLAIVTSPVAALTETVGNRGVMIEGDWLSDGYQKKLVDAVVKAMTQTTEKDRKKLTAFAHKRFGWDDLAREWDLMFRQIISEVSIDLVPKYKAAS